MSLIFRNPQLSGNYIFRDPSAPFVATIPQFVGLVTGSLKRITDLTVSFELDQECTVYYIAVLEGSTVPTPSQIKNGVDYLGVSVIASGSKVYTSGRDTYSIEGLGPADSTIVVYTTAEGIAGLQTSDLVDVLTVKLDYLQTAGFQSLFD